MTAGENVTESDISIQIGKNIRFFRKVKGLTLRQLADAVSEMSGLPVSGTTVGYWERGEKNISALHLHFAAVALDIKEQTLFDLGGFSGAEKQGHFVNMLNYALQWQGNRKALVAFVKLYMTLQKRDRADIVGMGISIYHRAKKAHRLDSEAPEIDISYLESEWAKLIR